MAEGPQIVNLNAHQNKLNEVEDLIDNLVEKKDDLECVVILAKRKSGGVMRASTTMTNANVLWMLEQEKLSLLRPELDDID